MTVQRAVVDVMRSLMQQHYVDLKSEREYQHDHCFSYPSGTDPGLVGGSWGYSPAGHDPPHSMRATWVRWSAVLIAPSSSGERCGDPMEYGVPFRAVTASSTGRNRQASYGSGRDR